MFKQWLRFVLVLWLGCQFAQGFAQMAHVPIGLGKARVLSEQGLVLRDRPGFSGRKLLTMPFGAEVAVVDNAGGAIDSLPPAFVFDSWTDTLQSMYREERIGFWVKVRYNGQVGFAFDIFLMQRGELHGDSDSIGVVQDKQLKELGINRNIRVLEPGSTCINNMVWEPGWTWWGLYEQDGRVTIRPVELQRHMYRLYNSTGTDQLGREAFVIYHRLSATAKEPNRLMLILGSKGNQHLRSEFSIRYPHAFDGALSYWDPEGAIGDLAKAGVKVECPKDERMQVFNCESWMEVATAQGTIRYDVPEGWPRWYLSPNLVADMDGDGIPDVLASYGEEWRATVLFLSSRAQIGRTCYPAAVYWSGYCC